MDRPGRPAPQVWAELSLYAHSEIADITFLDRSVQVVLVAPLPDLVGGTGVMALRDPPKAQETLLCELMISAFSAL